RHFHMDELGVLRLSANAQFIHMEVPIGLRLDNPVLSGIEFADGMFCIPDIYSTQWNTNILSLSLTEPSVEMSGNGDDLLGLLRDRKSTRLNSSHVAISYAVFCLKKKI